MAESERSFFQSIETIPQLHSLVRSRFVADMLWEHIFLFCFTPAWMKPFAFVDWRLPPKFAFKCKQNFHSNHVFISFSFWQAGYRRQNFALFMDLSYSCRPQSKRLDCQPWTKKIVEFVGGILIFVKIKISGFQICCYGICGWSASCCLDHQRSPIHTFATVDTTKAADTEEQWIPRLPSSLQVAGSTP